MDSAHTGLARIDLVHTDSHWAGLIAAVPMHHMDSPDTRSAYTDSSAAAAPFVVHRPPAWAVREPHTCMDCSSPDTGWTSRHIQAGCTVRIPAVPTGPTTKTTKTTKPEQPRPPPALRRG